MHELGMCQGIADAVLRRAAGRRVSAARVRVGGHAVDRDVVEQGFRLAAAGTLAEDAALDLVHEPMTVRCRGCGNAGPVTDHLAMVACPRCGGVDIELSGSDDVVLESVTIDAGPASADAAAGSPDEHPTSEQLAVAGPAAARDRGQGRPQS